VRRRPRPERLASAADEIRDEGGVESVAAAAAVVADVVHGCRSRWLGRWRRPSLLQESAVEEVGCEVREEVARCRGRWTLKSLADLNRDWQYPVNGGEKKKISSGGFLPSDDSKAVCGRPRKHFLTPPDIIEIHS
jgi:hypothetical protein